MLHYAPPKVAGCWLGQKGRMDFSLSSASIIYSVGSTHVQIHVGLSTEPWVATFRDSQMESAQAKSVFPSITECSVFNEWHNAIS